MSAQTIHRQARLRLTRRGRVALGVLIVAVFCVLPGDPPLPNGDAGVDNASVTQR